MISWRHNPTRAVHPIVAAKVLHVWERHNPDEATALDALLHGGKADKLVRFQADDGPSTVFKASRLRALYAKRFTEITALVATFSEEQLNTTTTPGGECFYEHELPEHGGGGGGGGSGGGCGSGGAGKAGAGAAGSGTAAPKRAYRRRSSGGEGHPTGTTGTAAAAAAAAGNGAGARTGAGSGRRSSSCASSAAAAAASSRPSPPPSSSPKPRRRSQVKEVVASDGRRYTLPLCIREKGRKLQLYVSLRTHRVDGQSLYTEPSAEYSPLQRPYGRADITRENLLALR